MHESPIHAGVPRTGLVGALGFATAVSMWAIAYFSLMSPGLVAGEILFGMLFLAVGAGGFAAARLRAAGESGVKAGLMVALVAATVNLLIVGSLFGRGTDGSILRQLFVWIGGLYAASAACGIIGGAIGGRASAVTLRMAPTSLCAAVAAATVFLLLVTGGIVTGHEAGLAVPDWPNSFGHNMFLYPLSEMKEGIYLEHAHRLYGTLVGLTSIALLVQVMRTESRAWVRAFMTALFIAVCIQGLMGALRVTGTFTLSQDRAELEPSVGYGVIHGIFGQLVFAGFCVLAAATSSAWRSGALARTDDSLVSGRSASQVAFILLLLQLISGALYRHFQLPSGTDAPPSNPAWAMHLHLTWSVVAFAAMIWLGIRAMKAPADCTPLKTLGRLIHGVVTLQMLLGIVALVYVLLRKSAAIPTTEVVFTTAHQANGALLIGLSALTVAWFRRWAAQSVPATGLIASSSASRA
jgi:cytochrome c oxidase assembly protein subunit 15